MGASRRKSGSRGASRGRSGGSSSSKSGSHLGGKSGDRSGGNSRGGVWLYGTHAVLAALSNPNRRFYRLCATPEGLQRLESELTPPIHPESLKTPVRAFKSPTEPTVGKSKPIVEKSPTTPPIEPEPLDPQQLSRLLPQDAVHQGLALLAEPLPLLGLTDLMAGNIQADTQTDRQTDIQGNSKDKPDNTPCLIIALDQVSDPRNVGAVLRSAAVFGATAMLTTERKAASESGALAKAASGGLEIVPRIAVSNLAKTLASLKQQHNFWICALASGTGRLQHDKRQNPPRDGFQGHSPQLHSQSQLHSQLQCTLDQAVAQATSALPVRVVLVLGAEGKGVRPLVAKQADALVRIPTAGKLSELNVSNAAAVALYAFRGVCHEAFHEQGNSD